MILILIQLPSRRVSIILQTLVIKPNMLMITRKRISRRSQSHRLRRNLQLSKIFPTTNTTFQQDLTMDSVNSILFRLTKETQAAGKLSQRRKLHPLRSQRSSILRNLTQEIIIKVTPMNLTSAAMGTLNHRPRPSRSSRLFSHNRITRTHWMTFWEGVSQTVNQNKRMRWTTFRRTRSSSTIHRWRFRNKRRCKICSVLVEIYHRMSRHNKISYSRYRKLRLRPMISSASTHHHNNRFQFKLLRKSFKKSLSNFILY